MTLSEVSSLLPPPDGMEWKDQSFRGEAHFYLSHLCPPGGCTVMREPGGWTVYASAGNASAQFVLVTDEDLPAAYLRALTAVGLAPDAEKEDMRRRLTWSEDVPTGDGLVLVWHPGDDEPEMWRTLGTADGIQWEHHNYVGHGNPFPPGTRFLPLVNLKEP